MTMAFGSAPHACGAVGHTTPWPCTSSAVTGGIHGQRQDDSLLTTCAPIFHNLEHTSSNISLTICF